MFSDRWQHTRSLSISESALILILPAGSQPRASWQWRSRRRWMRCCLLGTRKRPKSIRWPAILSNRTSWLLAPTQVQPPSLE